MIILDFVYVSLATYYLATAFVDISVSIVNWYTLQPDPTVTTSRRTSIKKSARKWWWLLKWWDMKPLNCTLCMSFYFSIILVILVQNVSVIFILIPAAAGVALLISKIHQKLETFI